MLTMKQFAAWKRIFDEDPEYADEVLRYIHDMTQPLPTPEEAIENLIADDCDDELPLGIANRPGYGKADECAKKILGMS